MHAKNSNKNAVNRTVAKQKVDFLTFSVEALTEYFPSNSHYITTA